MISGSSEAMKGLELARGFYESCRPQLYKKMPEVMAQAYAVKARNVSAAMTSYPGIMISAPPFASGYRKLCLPPARIS